MTTAEAFTTADIKEYTWTAVAGKSGNYDTLNLAGADVTIEPIGIDSDVYTIVTGKTYEVKAYFVGYYNYASIVLTELKEVVIPAEGITIEANRTEVAAGGTVTFTANLTPAGASGEVIYTITEGSEFGSIEGNVLTTTAVGTIKVQATVNEVTSNEVTITVKETSEVPPEPVAAFDASFTNSTATGGYKDQTFKLDEKDFHMNTGQCASSVFYLGHNKSLENYSLKDGMSVSEEYRIYLC